MQFKVIPSVAGMHGSAREPHVSCFSRAHIRGRHYGMTTKRYSPDWLDYPTPRRVADENKLRRTQTNHGAHNGLVAVTYLFPFVNQCPRQAIRLYTDQSGTEHIDSFFPFKTIFLVLFGSRSTVREHQGSSQDRPLSRPLLRTFHMERLLRSR